MARATGTDAGTGERPHRLFRPAHLVAGCILAVLSSPVLFIAGCEAYQEILNDRMLRVGEVDVARIKAFRGTHGRLPRTLAEAGVAVDPAAVDDQGTYFPDSPSPGQFWYSISRSCVLTGYYYSYESESDTWFYHRESY